MVYLKQVVFNNWLAEVNFVNFFNIKTCIIYNFAIYKNIGLSLVIKISIYHIPSLF